MELNAKCCIADKAIGLYLPKERSDTPFKYL